MKKVVLIILFSLLFVPLIANASLDTNLYYGLTNSSKVKELQQFLISKKLLVGSATGNFFSMTLKAVKAYQGSLKINQTGYVGPLTRAAINKELVVTTPVTVITPPVVVTGTPLVSITAPKVDADLVKGRTYTITWTSENIPAGLTATIRLYLGNFTLSNANSAIATVATNVPISEGKYSWTVLNEASINSGAYQIAMFYNIGDKYYNSVSQTFNLQNPDPKITITYPKLGASLVKGRTYTITWTSQDIPETATVNINFYPMNSVTQGNTVIASNLLLSTGKISWTVPDIYIDQYKISIVSSNGIKADSDVFNIQPPQPKITITSPKTGESLVKGKPFVITWSSQDVPANIPLNIYLCRDMGDIADTLNNIITATPENPMVSAGKYSWTIPNIEKIFPYKYIIYILSNDKTVSAWSGSFYVTQPIQ